MTDNDSAVVLFPEFVSLKAEVEKLRTEMSMLLLKRDELCFVECKNIEMAYMLALGSLEYKAYELQCAALRLKRKIELIQARKNRQEKPDLLKIEETLDEEFIDYQVRLDEQIHKMNEALRRSQGKALSSAESRELKKLYRRVVKALHPDLYPNLSKEQITLFHNAVRAYENGDLNGLRIISEMVGEPVLTDNRENEITLLKQEKERLTDLISVLRNTIEDIKQDYPYTMKSVVQSDEKTMERKAELEKRIAEMNDLLKIYKEKIAEMLR